MSRTPYWRRAGRMLTHRPQPERVSGIGALGFERVTPRVSATVRAAGGLLPLGLGGEPLARPAAVVGGLTPAEDRHRIFSAGLVRQVASHRDGARPSLHAALVAPVGDLDLVDPEPATRDRATGARAGGVGVAEAHHERASRNLDHLDVVHRRASRRVSRARGAGAMRGRPARAAHPAGVRAARSVRGSTAPSCRLIVAASPLLVPSCWW